MPPNFAALRPAGRRWWGWDPDPCGHLVPGGEREAADRLSAYLDRSTVAQPLRNAKSPANAGLPKYRYRDSN